MATINGVEVIGDKSAHDFGLLDNQDKTEIDNGIERNREAAEDNREDIVRHRTDTDVHVTPEWKNSLVSKETLGLYWTAAQTADIINEISIAGGAKLVKVDELPETGKEQTIYLVPKTDPLERDIFDEYVWIDGKFEFIGTTKVDLANYATKTELNAKQDALSAQQIQNIADVTNKANDADVVHKNGNETIDGIKIFSSSPQIIKTSPEILLNISDCDVTEIPTENKQAVLYFRDKNNKILSYVTGQRRTSGENRICVRAQRTDINGYYSIGLDNNGDFYPENNLQISLGTSAHKWKTINGINPGALSLPNVNDNVVTVDTTTFQWGANWTYTPAFDGWISVWVPASSATKRRYSASQEYLRFWYPNQNGEVFRFSFPVVKGVPIGFGFISDIEEPAAPNIYLLKALGNV